MLRVESEQTRERRRRRLSRNRFETFSLSPDLAREDKSQRIRPIIALILVYGGQFTVFCFCLLLRHGIACFRLVVNKGVKIGDMNSDYDVGSYFAIFCMIIYCAYRWSRNRSKIRRKYFRLRCLVFTRSLTFNLRSNDFDSVSVMKTRQFRRMQECVPRFSNGCCIS